MSVNLKLSESQKDRLAQLICDEIDASESAKGTLPSRWERNEKMYHVDPSVATMQIVDGIDPYAFPLYRQKADAVIGSIYSSITSAYPYVQALDEQDGENQEEVERGLMAMADSACFDQRFKSVLLPVVNTNIGVMRVRPLEKKKPVSMDWIHPKNVMCYPAEEVNFADAKTVGHRFYQMRYRIEAQQKTKFFYEGPIFGDDNPKDNYKGAKDLTEPTPAVVPGDEQVELWEVVTEQNIDGEYKRYICIVARSQKRLLRCQAYPYSRPWYFDIRLSDPGGSVWPNGSLGQVMQGLQGAFNDGHTLTLQGGMMDAFPMVVVSGGSLPVKTKKYGPSTMIEAPVGVTIQSVKGGFNPSVIPVEMQVVENLADAVTGISQLGTGQNLPASTSATAADGLLQAQAERKGQYVDSISPSIQQVWEFLYELLQAHFDEIKKALGSRFPQGLTWASISDRSFLFKVTGQGGGASPNIMLQKLQFLLKLAENPESGLDYRKIVQKILTALDLPFSARGLEKEALPIDPNEIMQLLMAVQGGQVPVEQAAQMLMQDIQDAQTGQDQREGTLPLGGLGALLPALPANDGGAIPGPTDLLNAPSGEGL